MWLDKLRELRKKSGKTNKYLAEQMHRSERTIGRFFSGEADLGIDELQKMVDLMGGKLEDILDESDFKLPTPEVETLKKEIASLITTIEEMTAKETLLNAEIAAKEKQIVRLTAENDILRIKLEYEQKIANLHDYYNKLK
jgi:transcriptional regulator with XRE-family HTH domain